MAEVLSKQVPAALEKFVARIGDLDAEIEKGQQFKAIIDDNHPLFTQDEIALVSNFVDSMVASRAELLDELRVRLDLYEKKVLLIEEKLRKRKMLLETVDNETNMLSDNQHLMDVFVQGHVTLKSEMDSALASVSG